MPVLKLGDALPALPAEPKVNKTTEVKAEDLQTVRFSIQNRTSSNRMDGSSKRSC